MNYVIHTVVLIIIVLLFTPLFADHLGLIRSGKWTLKSFAIVASTILALVVWCALFGQLHWDGLHSVKTPTTITKWEHGYRTDDVIATRYQNDIFGWNIGLRLTNDQHNCDRAELIEFIEANNGTVFACGGSPGAEVTVLWKEVDSKVTASKKIVEVLPSLDSFIKTLR